MKKVMAFGTFDGLHEGHRYFLNQAKILGDYLVAVVAQDKAVEELKHKKTKSSLGERIAAIENENLADEVVGGDIRQGSWEIIKNSRPDIVAIGHDQDALFSALTAAKEKFDFPLEIKRIEFFQSEGAASIRSYPQRKS